MEYIKILKDFFDVVIKSDNIDLIKKGYEAQQALYESLEENQKLKERVKQLENDLEISKELVFRNKLYYMEGDDIPFCPRCWEGNRKMIHLKGVEFAVDRYNCPECKQHWRKS